MGKRKFFCHDTDLANNLDAVRELSEIKMEDLPWGENERENLFKSVGKNQSYDGGNDFAICEIKGLNRNKSYDFVIRGDVYPNVTAHSEHSYYDWVVWGTYSFNADGAEYPFALTTADDVHWQEGDKTGVSSMYDKDGNFDYDRNTSDADPRLRISWTKYPDLKPEEIEIYDASIPAITKISGKYVEGMGWSEGGGENLIKGLLDDYESNSTLFYLNIPKLNMFKSYDITVRGDVYKRVAPRKINPYYDMFVWGSYYGDDANYPFGMTTIRVEPGEESSWGTESCPWDNEGNWVGYEEPYAKYVDSWAEPQIMIDAEKYPNLTIDEIQIAEAEIIHPIDPKFLPIFAPAVTVDAADEDCDNWTCTLSGANFAELLAALKANALVWVNVNYINSEDPEFTFRANVECFSDNVIRIMESGRGYTYDINPDNSVTLG